MTATDGIDRMAPTVRPAGRAAMKQRWSDSAARTGRTQPDRGGPEDEDISE